MRSHQRSAARSALFVLLVAVPSLLSAQQTANGAALDTDIQPFLAKNCYVCHNAQLKSGEIDLEQYKSEASVAQDWQAWEKVEVKLRTGQMPPPGMPRPDKATIKTVTSWIEDAFARAEQNTKPNPGRVVARRLNRAEYNNTIRDLLGVDFQPAAGFPEDDSGYGFDNIGDVLTLSPILMEKYLAAAENVVRAALFGPQDLKPTLVRHQPPQKRRLEVEGGYVEIPRYYSYTDYDTTGLSQPQAIHATHYFPADGEYILRVFTQRNRPARSDPAELAVWVDGKIVSTLEVGEQETEGEKREVRVPVKKGQRWIAGSFLHQFEGLPAIFGAPNPTKNPPPPERQGRGPRRGPQPPGENAAPEELAKYQQEVIEAGKRNLRVGPDALKAVWIEVVGPFEYTRGPSNESLRKIFTCGHLHGGHDAACARKIVSGFARRAFRRPATPQEVDGLAGFVSRAQKDGRSFEEGIGLALQATLILPDFLFRIEQDPRQAKDEDAYLISQYELASRLSYFIWSSMPDDELLSAAGKGTLRQPEVLEAQVRRMLQDPKSRGLVDNFGGQWLRFRAIQTATPDRERYPDFEDYLRMSMRRETELFFEFIIKEDRSILDFIDAKYTFLNERLARHYGIPGVTGPEFRKVDLTGTNRGGVLTQASVLTVASYPNRTSPVLRGKFILENILDAPPPPPPPDVPNLDEAKVGQTASLREQLEQHRANPACASCHNLMDPIGFAMENYDAVGAWRSKDGNFPIDPSGTLPDGRSFEGPAGFREILMADRDAFAQALTSKMLTFALGRGLERYDRRTVKKIAESLPQSDYRLSRLVLEIVKSQPFQMRNRGDQGS